MPKVVSNTTPIISLLKIGHLELLQKLYKTIFIPEAAYREIEVGKAKPFSADLSKLDWIIIQKIKNRKPLIELDKLDDGEAEVILLARELNADLVILDELLGRQFASSKGLVVTGTLGLLIKAKESCIIQKVEPLLRELQNQGIWMSDKLVSSILKKTNENF
jgi:uncharacterized protein